MANSLVSFTDSLTVTAGIMIEERVVVAVMECSNKVNRDEEIVTAAVVIVEEVLEYPVVKGDGDINDCILDSKVTEGKIDSERDFVTTIFLVIVFSIAVA